MHLLDDDEAVAPLDDALDRRVAVAGREQEPRSVGADLLVFGERRLDAFSAVRVAAFADEVGLACLEALGVLGDALVHLAEGRFCAGFPLRGFSHEDTVFSLP